MVARLTDPVTIDAGQIIVLPPGQRHVIQSLRGILWITQSGNVQDTLLHAHESVALPPTGKVMIQTLRGQATFRVTPTHRPLGSRLRAWLDRLADEARENPVAPTLAVATRPVTQGSPA